MTAPGEDRRGNYQWLVDLIQDGREEAREQHRRTNDRIEKWGAKLEAEMEKLRAELASHKRDDDKVADDVLILKTLRENEADQSLKRTTLTSVVVASAVTAIGWVVQHLWK